MTNLTRPFEKQHISQTDQLWRIMRLLAPFYCAVSWKSVCFYFELWSHCCRHIDLVFFLYFLVFILMIFFSFCYNVIWNSATSISCYVCNATDSSSPFQCGEWFERYDTPDIVPQDCSNVYGAKYCVKHIGRFEGKCSWSTNNDLLLIHGYMGLVRSGLSGNANKHVFLSFIYSLIIFIFFSLSLLSMHYY